MRRPRLQKTKMVLLLPVKTVKESKVWKTFSSCHVDTNVWEVEKYDIGTYEVTGFDKAKRPIPIPMYRTAWLKK